MANKTDGVKILVQEVLAAAFSESPYSEDIILDVCNAIYDKDRHPEWRRRYDELSDDLRYGWVVNNWVGQYVKDETGLNSLRKVSTKGKSKIIKSYTKLGHA